MRKGVKAILTRSAHISTLHHVLKLTEYVPVSDRGRSLASTIVLSVTFCYKAYGKSKRQDRLHGLLGLTPRIPRTVYRYFSAYPLLPISFFFFFPTF